ncbi:MAG: Gfo/Idh/MocA family oxidoreductase [Elusimicrobiota bacterium]|nr:Gfo/Idh/MocA family oxidoreductase [Endomicrobiia bacterium]MDW8165306.1 Gfo/Idh/MocA family oxidoreductase [Elusimicrobiota bacterium]
MKKKINVAVIGCGNLGQHHVRIYNSLDSVRLVAVVDIDTEKLKKIKQIYSNIETTTNYKEIIDKVDAVSIVVPTKLHYQISKDILQCNKHILVEKPITTTLQEAEELIRISQQRNLILQVGHVERFNPIVQKIKEYIKEPKFIEAIRLNNFDPRVADIGVVLDLMIHDIDIILYFMKDVKLKRVEAFGGKVFTDKEDIVKARLEFDNGCICDLTTSRVSPTKYRKMHIFQKESYISLDFIRQQAKIYKKTNSDTMSLNNIEITRLKVKKDEPLKLEIEHFINSILENKKPLVSGEHAKNALEIALEILNNLKFQ